MRKITTALLTGSALLLFTACGGGSSNGGSGEVTPPANTNKYDLRALIDTTSYLIDLKGTVNGNEILAVARKEFTHTDEFQGRTYNIQEMTNTTAIDTEVSYAATYQGNVYGYLDENYDIACMIPTDFTPTPVPTDATVGYKSDVLPLECLEGESANVTLNLTAGSGNNAIAITTINMFDSNGNPAGTDKSYFTIDPDGNLLNYEAVGDNYHLKSTLIQQY